MTAKSKTLKSQSDRSPGIVKESPEDHLIGLTRTCKIDKVRTFLDENPDIDVLSVKDSRYYSLLHIASLNSQIAMCHYLLNHAKQKAGSFEEIKKWVNAKTDEGFTALHFASFKGNIDLIKLLEANGADIYATNYQGLTVIHIAAQGDQPVSMAYFKMRGLNIHEKDKKGSTPLHWAAFLGMENSTNYLTSWGSMPNMKDNDTGLTPLHLAVISGNPRVVRRLLIRGADRFVPNKEGKMAIDLAKENDYENIVHLLQNRNWFLRYLNITPSLHKKRTRLSLYLFLFLFLTTVGANVSFIFPFIENLTWVILFVLSTSLTFFFFLSSWLTNPGYMKNKQRGDILNLLLNNDPHLVCPDCVIVKPERSKHCDYCQACISVYDHHCPWINNCVGSRNHAYFVLFILSTLFAMLVLVFMSAFYFSSYDADYIYFPFFKYPKHYVLFMTKNVVCGLNFLSAMFFLIPLFALNYVQLGNIFSGKTTNERYGFNSNKDNLNQTMNQSMSSGIDEAYTRIKDDGGWISQSANNCVMMCCLNKKDSRYNFRPSQLTKARSSNLESSFSL